MTKFIVEGCAMRPLIGITSNYIKDSQFGMVNWTSKNGQ